MIFSGTDSQTVELKIANYQFPEVNDGSWDANWLNIYLNVKSKVGNWQTVDPSLTTWEVQSMIEWFECLSKNKQPEYINLSFTEPNLSFELLSEFNTDKKTFRIKFDLELRPLSATEGKEYFVDVIADNRELQKLSNDIQTELEKYPQRL